MMNKILTMTSMMKKKIPKMTKMTMPTIMNTKNQMKTIQPTFYRNQINFRSHTKLRNNKNYFSRKKKITPKNNYSDIHRETIIQTTKKRYSSKWMINMAKKSKIKTDVEQKQSEYRHKCGNTYKQEHSKKKNTIQSQSRSLR